MTRTSTFIVATLAAITAASLASTSASARGGGHAAAGGFSGPASPAGFGHAPIAHGIGNASNPAFGKTGTHRPSVNQLAHLPPHRPTVNGSTTPPTTMKGYRYGMGGGGYFNDCFVRLILPNGRQAVVDVCTRSM